MRHDESAILASSKERIVSNSASSYIPEPYKICRFAENSAPRGTTGSNGEHFARRINAAFSSDKKGCGSKARPRDPSPKSCSNSTMNVPSETVADVKMQAVRYR